MLLVSILQILFLLSSQNEAGWPEGTYGLPKPNSGCPKEDSYYWKFGYRKHKTEVGSHSSNNSELSGIENNLTDYIVQEFCIKINQSGDSNNKFMPGKYCLLKKGNCPNNFRYGSIYWDDAVKIFTKSKIQSKAGVLPDGIYDTNTEIEYCCNIEGSPLNPIRLPYSQPFYLYKYGPICQQVENMEVREEFVYWKDESTLNLNKESGTCPAIERKRIPLTYTKLFYCYYRPIGKYGAVLGHSNIISLTSLYPSIATLLNIFYITILISAIIFGMALFMTGCQRAAMLWDHKRISRLSRNESRYSNERTNLSFIDSNHRIQFSLNSSHYKPPPYTKKNNTNNNINTNAFHEHGTKRNCTVDSTNPPSYSLLNFINNNSSDSIELVPLNFKVEDTNSSVAVNDEIQNIPPSLDDFSNIVESDIEGTSVIFVGNEVIEMGGQIRNAELLLNKCIYNKYTKKDKLLNYKTDFSLRQNGKNTLFDKSSAINNINSLMSNINSTINNLNSTLNTLNGENNSNNHFYKDMELLNYPTNNKIHKINPKVDKQTSNPTDLALSLTDHNYDLISENNSIESLRFVNGRLSSEKNERDLNEALLGSEGEDEGPPPYEQVLFELNNIDSSIKMSEELYESPAFL